MGMYINPEKPGVSPHKEQADQIDFLNASIKY